MKLWLIRAMNALYRTTVEVGESRYDTIGTYPDLDEDGLRVQATRLAQGEKRLLSRMEG